MIMCFSAAASFTGGAIVSAVGIAAFGYLLYAQGLLPAFMPLAVLLLEPTRRRRLRVVPFVVLGLAAGTYLFWIDVARPVDHRMVEQSIVYENTGSLTGVAAVVYVVAVCGAALLSGYRWIVAFGVANLVALVATLVVQANAFTSVWCFYAALISVLVLLFLRDRQRQEPAVRPTIGV